jgi:hypothetical protein
MFCSFLLFLIFIRFGFSFHQSHGSSSNARPYDFPRQGNRFKTGGRRGGHPLVHRLAVCDPCRALFHRYND